MLDRQSVASALERSSRMPRTFELAFEELLTAMRDWAECGNPMPPNIAREKLRWLFEAYSISRDNLAGIEQQENARARLEETVRLATEYLDQGRQP
jgi:hypothetical protein